MNFITTQTKMTKTSIWMMSVRVIFTRAGALICRGDIYIQWLEGPEEQVRKALERIKRDNRHLEVMLHVAEPVSERMFGRWAMLHDPAASWIWSQDEVADGAVERATPEEVIGFFTRLHELNRAPESG